MASIRDSSTDLVKAHTKAPSKTTRTVVSLGLWLSLLAPTAWIAWKFFSIPSANPAQELNHLFGRVGYYALALNLWIGSLLAFFKIQKKPWPRNLAPVIAYRRHLGVAGALYLVAHVALHFLMEAGVNEGFQAIIKARYLWVGAAAFIGLIILAATSNNWSMKRLKLGWKRLHRLSYLLFVLATAHTLMIEKADLPHFGFIAVLTALPLLARFSRWLMSLRTARVSAR